jgi:hypothetical protein
MVKLGGIVCLEILRFAQDDREGFRTQHELCYCEEQSDEAISVPSPVILKERSD